ncbi:GNAT family N-acetyltransferase [Arthrobacter zhaoxinii]|uniref:GNAT family N-acetyltransferase n=1 Tax=Arthrobacter zhaoxinii TaxID=2964616 RepID=UPI002101F737|nr:GNAT family N-acetyltransferase [Arthrobacter zhaoxinii]MCQ1999960.1 GNAT family N-acetyltransferase [Arthrobacter zhaoxinii]
MPELISPDAAWHHAWRQAHLEWGPGLHEDGFGLLPGDDVEAPAGFDSWLHRLAANTRCTYLWITEDGRVLGGIALRHEEHEAVPRAGHLGYGIRPSARRRGVAAWAVEAMLNEARRLGMSQVLAVSAADNRASVRTLEAAGGVLQQDDDGGQVRRYVLAAAPGSE